MITDCIMETYYSRNKEKCLAYQKEYYKIRHAREWAKRLKIEAIRKQKETEEILRNS